MAPVKLATAAQPPSASIDSVWALRSPEPMNKKWQGKPAPIKHAARASTSVPCQGPKDPRNPTTILPSMPSWALSSWPPQPGWNSSTSTAFGLTTILLAGTPTPLRFALSVEETTTIKSARRRLASSSLSSSGNMPIGSQFLPTQTSDPLYSNISGSPLNVESKTPAQLNLL